MAELTALLDAHDASQAQPLWPSLIEAADRDRSAAERPAAAPTTNTCTGRTSMRRSLILWSILAALYVGFRVWYDGGGRPLTPEEVQRYVAIFEERGVEPARVENLRKFLSDDDGRDFVMANFIHFQERPGAQEELDRYMAHMYPAMFRRASHPVLAGPVVAGAVDLWGIENAERWSMVGLVRYRSRRDLIEIATAPAFRDAYPFKVSSMAQTIAVPTQPFLSLGSPRWLVGGALVTLGALLQLALGRRTA